MKFNVDQVFEIAERIEGNAAEFYTKAADIHSASSDVAFLRDLAQMELNHQKLFAAWRRALPDLDREPPSDYPYLVASLQLESMAGAHGGEGRLSNAFPLGAEDSLRDVVLAGLRGEERTIVFYHDLRELVPADRGREEMDRIIREEKRHAAVLAAKLAELDEQSGA